MNCLVGLPYTCLLKIKRTDLLKKLKILMLFIIPLVNIYFKISYLYCGPQVIYGPCPFTHGESKGPSWGGLWPKPDNIKHRIALGYSREQFSPRQNPKSHRTEGQKRYRIKFERKSKISRENCPYCHSILCTWQSRILQLLQPPPTTLSMDWWDKYQFWKV